MLNNIKTEFSEKEWKEILNDLANDLIEYDADYCLVSNNNINYYGDYETKFLKCPYAIKLFISNSENYLGEDYSEILYLNENGDGLEYRYDDNEIAVESPEWIYLGYAKQLENKIEQLNYKINNIMKGIK